MIITDSRKLFSKSPSLGLRAVILAILSLVLIFSNYHLPYFRKVKSIFSVVVIPIQYLVSWPIESFKFIDDYVTSKHKLLLENDRLRIQNLWLQIKLQKMLILKKENKQLYVLLNSSSKLSNKTMVARLLSVNANPFNPQIMLNKGSNNKVYVGQPVLDSSGIVGQVIDVYPITCRVLLITNVESAIPVEDSRSGIRGIAIGNGYFGNLKLKYIPNTSDVKVGDLFVTSGLGLTFPQGYLVGKVIAVQHIVGKRFAKIIIKPLAKLNIDRQVLLIWKK